MTPERAMMLAEFRNKARDNTLTPAELRQAIVLLREDRIRADGASKTSRSPKAKPDADKMLDELDGL